MSNYNKHDAVLGIDIGGTNTKYGLVTPDGKLIHKGSCPTNSGKPISALFKNILGTVKKVKKDLNIIGIGIGAPNANYFNGYIESPPNLKWGTVNVKKELKKLISCPVALTNDANAGAIGEMIFGNGKGINNFIFITLGTGLGSGLIVDGKLVYGHDGFAGEIGHVIVKENGRLCGCGRKGCLETYVSAPGLKRTAFEILSDLNCESLLTKIPYEKLTAKNIFEAAAAKDKVAMLAFEKTGEILGKALANSIAYLSPKAIFLFGGLVEAGDLLFKPVKKYMNANTLNIMKNKVTIMPSGLDEGSAAVLGAAALIINELEKLKLK